MKKGLLRPRPRMWVLGMLILAVLPLLFAACTRVVVRALAPTPPDYPCFTNRQEVIEEAWRISRALEKHIRSWLEGHAPPEIPERLIPGGVDLREIGPFTLRRPEEVDPDRLWCVREAHDIDLRALYGYFADPHCTYLVLPIFAPFGSRIIVEGEFPHCRFFSLQVTPSFHPEAYYCGWIGAAEVPIVDVDIEPWPGHVNPFRVGADRTATNRRYRVTFELAVGNPVALNPGAFEPPRYRAPGNRRVGSAIVYQGPWGRAFHDGPGGGRFNIGSIWIRYYAPDKARGPLAGVARPRVWAELPDGRPYYLEVDGSRWIRRMNRTRPARVTAPVEPKHADAGWDKMFGIFRSIVSGIARATGALTPEYVRALDKGVAGRGEDLPPPGNYEPGATCCTHINYLTRGMSLGKGKVAVLTGRLPTTPRTRDGEPVMTAAQARYWSLTGYDQAWPEHDGYVGAAVHSIMDDEILTDTNGWYVIVFSRAEDRPTNAVPSNGVTWVNWGPTAAQSWTLRWLSVAPEWAFEKTPDELRLDWRTDWASTVYDARLLGRNSTNGFLGDYHPVVHYLDRTEFEKLRGPIRPSDIPLWSQ
ncbi:MAG: hypothetical protein RMN51_09330 [Verrucomicrobiota bacterium]|nr:hypothetical protein [Limisphaera sp.]MDW8382293.1 hypothetical protein [Verrucomicrobiota bacterium]